MPPEILILSAMPCVAGKPLTLTGALLSAWDHESAAPELARYSARDARFINAWRVRLGVPSYEVVA